jgi:electron transfer flavoprotein beta subunit
LPALVTVSNEVGELRYVSRTKMMALLKRPAPIPKWGAKDLVDDPARLKTIQLLSLAPPPDMRRECVIIEGSSPAEKADRLAAVIMEMR